MGYTCSFQYEFNFFAKENVKTDINPLWNLFEYAINSPNDDIFISSFNTVFNQKQIGMSMITMALYWIRPKLFIPLDNNTQAYLESQGIQIMKKNDFSGKSYLDLIERVQKSSLFSEKKSFPAISREAWVIKHPQINEDKGEDRGIEENRESNPIVSTAYNLLQLKKNVILQGVPGTGKTYSTAEIALRILGVNVDFSNHKTVMERYRELCEQERIFFTTFHQSMDYEDFVEGLKPIVTDEGVRYKIERGIFWKICENARRLFNQRKSSKKIDFTRTRIFKMSLGEKDKNDSMVFDYCKEHDVVALGWGENKDFSNYQSHEGILKLYEDEKDNRFGPIAMERFICWMRKDDIILISDGNSAVKAIARIVGDYEFHNDTPIGMCQFIKVEWLYLGDNIPLSKLYNCQFIPQSIYAFYTSDNEGTSQYNGSINTDMINKIITGEVNSEEPQPYVLIIDEINRGNVSKIFGELVTLLEADKRDDGNQEGGKHTISVILPYSKERFSVPSNVYIIGTMNTTDRSTGTLDYAIRRRFAFVTLPADPKVIPEGIARELFNDIQRFIKAHHPEDMDINDLMVGHSYFMPDEGVSLSTEEQLKLKIKYEVAPLLREYCTDGLLTCPQKELDKRIESWEKLEITYKKDSSAESAAAASGSETSQTNE